MSVPGVAADELPYIDAHSVEVQAPAGRVWDEIVENPAPLRRRHGAARSLRDSLGLAAAR